MNFNRVLITGGSTGIGLHTARHLFKNGMTEKVCIGDELRDEGECAVKELNCEYGECSAMFIKCDVAKKSQLQDLFKRTVSSFGGLDLVINNAGILNDKVWERQIAINLTALVRGSFLGIEYMGKNKGGCGGTVVNLSSILGLATIASSPVYCATKHAVLGFSRAMGMPFNFNRTGVRFLTICPGVTITPLITEAHNRTLIPEYAPEIRNELDSIPSQPVECVAIGLIHVLKCGESGSVWVTEGAEPIYEVEIPERQSIRKGS